MQRIWSEDNTFSIWLKVEIVVCEAWHEIGVITTEDLNAIRLAKFNITRYNEIFNETKHDIVSFTKTLAESVGESGRWIHYGMTSNDLKDTALCLQLVQSVDILIKEVQVLMELLKDRAIEFKDTPIIGRSHGIHAEPMSFGLKFALWWDEMQRHIDRLKALRTRVGVCKISGPVGTFATIPPQIEEIVAKKLSVSRANISNQIIQRDSHAEYIQTLALIGATLEKIATEIRGLQRTEVSEVYEPFGEKGYVSKGSSSMPHKRNPEISERICGLARLLRGHTVTALDNVALWHERDISHSSAERIILPDSSIALDYMLGLMSGLIKGLQVDTQNMYKNIFLTHGMVFSSRVMLELVNAGMQRKTAYDIVQHCSLVSATTKQSLSEVLKSHEEVKPLLDKLKIDKLFDLSWYLRFTSKQFRRLGWNIES